MMADRCEEKMPDDFLSSEFMDFLNTTAWMIDTGKMKLTGAGTNKDLTILDVGLQFTIRKLVEERADADGHGSFAVKEILDALSDYCGSMFSTEEGFEYASKTTLVSLMEAES